MFRKARLIAPLLRSFVACGVIAFAAPTFLVGCEDDKDPMTHVKKLKDPVEQRQAIKRLLQMYADEESKDKKDPNKPNVKALLDKIMVPLGEACLDEKVKDQDRSKLVKFMADTRDARAEACLKKTLEEYKPDTNEDDVVNALLSVTAMKMTSLTPSVMKVYKTMEFSRAKAKPLRAHVQKALKTLADKSLEDEFLKMLDVPIELTSSPTPEQVNQGFWQQTAIIMLGELKSEKAAKPLLKLILTPSKGPLAQTAVVSLVKIGKASIPPVEAVLKGEDKEMLTHHETEILKGAEKDTNGKIPEAAQKAAKKAYIPIVAEVLGNLGSEASTPPLLAAIEAAKEDPTTKVIIALTLTLLPKSTEAIESYKKVYEETKLDLEIPAGPAKELLASRANDFFDTSLVPWLVKTSIDLKGENSEIDPVRQVAFVAAVKLMTPEQIAEVTTLKDTKAVTMVEDEKTKKEVKKDTTVGETYKEQFDQAKKLLETCKEDVKCYLAQATSDENKTKEKEFTAIKAMYMIGIYGKEADRDQLVDALPKVANMAVRATGLKVVEAMTPKNGVAPAEKLEKFYESAEELKDNEKMAEYQIFLQTAARLRARSQ